MEQNIMNVQTHEMDPRIARIHYHDYLGRVRTHREKRKEELLRASAEAGRELGRVRIAKTRLEEEDAELLTAYRALAREQRIILLPEVMKKAGADLKRHLPQLAISKADAEWVYFHASTNISGGNSKYSYGDWAVFSKDRWHRTTQDSVVLERSVFPAEVTNTSWRREHGVSDYPVRAMVPKVPPRLAPDDLSKFYILFEPKWEAEPPHLDPILLSRASETVFVVVAVWDMTPLEASALEGR